MVDTASSFSLGFASALRFGIVVSSKVEDCRECTIVTCIFSPAWLISRLGGFEGWSRFLPLLFTKFDNPKKGFKTLTFEVLKYDMLVTFRTFYRMFSSALF